MTGPAGQDGQGGVLNVDLQGWFAANQTPPPPPIVSDAVATGAAPIEQLLQVLGLAANQGDPKDNLEAQQGHAERKAITSDALEKFPAQDQAAQAEMKGVDQMSQMAQQMPQMIGGVAGAISGALGGALQPLAQIPQQLAQTGQQLLQQGMGAMQQAGKDVTPADLGATGLGEDILASDGEIGSGGGGSAGGAGGGGMGATTPMSALGPAATPTGSTVPTSGRASVAPPAAAPGQAHAPMGGMGGGYPMMPPGAMAGAGGGQDKDDKAATKRVSPPSVKNGAPVQGRITAPPPATAPTVTKNVDGKPVATRRIVVPNDKAGATTDSDGKGR